MNPDRTSLVVLAWLVFAFVLATALAYWRGRRDQGARTAAWRAEWDRRAWLAGRRSMKYDLSQVEGKLRATRATFWRN